jgi:trimeric autotransporter adhesin
MKTKISFTLLLSFSFYLLSSQVPQGFNYQAIARDGSNNIIPNYLLPVRITLQTASTGGTVIWQETQSVTTNQFGLLGLVVGKGTRTGGTATLFSDINWGAQLIYLKTEIKYPGASYVDMGTSQLWSVPYSITANDLTGPVKKLGITGTTLDLQEALFEVKNNTGQTVFAVYNEGVRVFVDDGAKGSKGGFAIGGFGSAKAPSQEYLRVTKDSTRVYVNPLVSKGSKGGFAIGGFDQAKGTVNSFLNLTKNNYFIGQSSGFKSTTGIYNSFIGYESGMNNTSGRKNVFLGYHAGMMNDTASFNVFIGNEAGLSNKFGRYNTIMGYQAGITPVSADYNTFVGYQTGYSNTTGAGNLFLGFTAGFNNTWGYRNVFLGYNSGKYNVGGYENTFVGGHSGYGFNGGNANVMVGTYSGNYFYGGDNNIFIGNSSGYGIKFSTTTASDNIFIGTSAGKLITTGMDNAFIGTESGFSNSTGSFNSFMGYRSGRSNTVGTENVFVGYQAGYSNIDGLRNVFLGYNAGYNNSSGTYNIFVGRQAGEANTTGTSNVYIGEGSGQSLPAGSINTFVGKGTGSNQTSGGFNVYIGGQSGIYKVAGNYNSFLGYHSGAYADGDNNVLVGFQAGMGHIGSGNVFIGYQTGANMTGYNNTLAIDNSSTMTPLLYGDFSLRRLRFNGNTSINGSSSNMYYALEVNLDANDTYGMVVYGPTWCSSGAWAGSDIRLKKNISPLNNSLGSVLKLNGVNFDWRTDEFPEMGFTKARQIGLIAQDVEKVFPELVNEGPNGYKSIDYSKITPVLIEAIKEQQKQIDSQNKRIDELEKAVSALLNAKK